MLTARTARRVAYGVAAAAALALLLIAGVYVTGLRHQANDLRHTANLAVYCMYDQSDEPADVCMTAALESISIAAGQ